MSDAFQRGMVLFAQQRFDLADREFRRGLADDPGNPYGHGYLALCLARRKQRPEALREADEAVRLEPALPFGHYVRGVVLLEMDRLVEAQAAADEAVGLDPFDADTFGLLSAIHVHRRQWPEALEAADRGLAVDPEHDQCTNLRALALVKLGRKAEAGDALHSALANDPENALTHANQGWAYLHRGDHARALEHFREALRIDPELEWAQHGIIEALKARHLVYRLMLRFFLWMDRLSQSAQWTVLLLFIFGRRILADLGRANPALQPFVGPILALSFGFLLLTWIASPLFDAVLLFNRFGRLALPTARKVGAVLISACFLAAATAFVLNLFDGTDATFVPMTFFGLLLIPLTVTVRRSPGRARWVMIAVTVVLIGLGLPAAVESGFDLRLAPGGAEQADQWWGFFLLGCILSSWLPALLSTRRDVR